MHVPDYFQYANDSRTYLPLRVRITLCNPHLCCREIASNPISLHLFAGTYAAHASRTPPVCVRLRISLPSEGYMVPGRMVRLCSKRLRVWRWHRTSNR